MRELALHIMDIMENGIGAGATLIHLDISENHKENRIRIVIGDNGRGIPKGLLDKVTDPFFTSRTTRRVGLGLSLFREASRRCEGEFTIASEEGKGTSVEATFRLDHIDLAPLGQIDGAMTSMIMGNPEVDFFFRHDVDGRCFEMDTREIRKELEEVPLNHPKVLQSISESIRKGEEGIRKARNENDGEGPSHFGKGA